MKARTAATVLTFAAPRTPANRQNDPDVAKWQILNQRDPRFAAYLRRMRDIHLAKHARRADGGA